MAHQDHYQQRGSVVRLNFQESAMPLKHMPSADLPLLTYPTLPGAS